MGARRRMGRASPRWRARLAVALARAEARSYASWQHDCRAACAVAQTEQEARAVFATALRQAAEEEALAGGGVDAAQAARPLADPTTQTDIVGFAGAGV